jgi:hypothetical protein
LPPAVSLQTKTKCRLIITDEIDLPPVGRTLASGGFLANKNKMPLWGITCFNPYAYAGKPATLPD